MDTYYLSAHKEGKIVRKINCGEDTLGVIQEGVPFHFEKELDQDLFDYDDMDEFCMGFGIDLFEIEERSIIIKIH
ncbi:hypothetical protein [Robertmurraya sp. P23]|uniref:hypothetical protein n=1 Tax=Robertmurraya sp. P23 TaxID=3436931 RepID=UPI003D9730EE